MTIRLALALLFAGLLPLPATASTVAQYSISGGTLASFSDFGGITFAPPAPGAGLNAASVSGNVISSTGYSTSVTRIADDRFEFGFSNNVGSTFDLTQITIATFRNNNGPQTGALFYSVDGGATETQIGSNFSLRTSPNGNGAGSWCRGRSRWPASAIYRMCRRSNSFSTVGKGGPAAAATTAA